jgi:hypothetical protein
VAIPEQPDLNDVLSGIKLSSNKPSSPNGGIQIPFMPTKDQSGGIGLGFIILSTPRSRPRAY